LSPLYLATIHFYAEFLVRWSRMWRAPSWI